MNNPIKQLLLNIIHGVFKKSSIIYNKVQYDNFRKKYSVDSSFVFNGEAIKLYGDGKILCGENSYIGSYSSIQSVSGCKVNIGKGCQISHFVNVYTSNNAADKDYSCDDEMRSGDVIIGDYCWIGIKASIIGPVKIGENSCIAANSIVTRDIPPHCIAIGVPAKVVKFKSYLSAEHKKEFAIKYRNVLADELANKLSI